MRLTALTISLALIATLAMACAGTEETPPTPTPINVSALIQEVMQAQPQPQSMTADDVAKAVQSSMAAQPGVTQAEVADAIAQAMRQQTPGITQGEVADAIANALAERPGVTEGQVADAIANALRQQTPGLTEAEVSEAIAKVLAERPGITQADITKAVEDAVAMAVPTPADTMMDDSMMMGPSGKVTGAVVSVGTPSGWPTDCVWCATFPNIGAGEVLVTATRSTSGEFITEPWVAESWDLAPDQSYIDWKIREGIQFHQDWGELTAEDVVYTYNAGNPGITPEAVHDTLPSPTIGKLDLLSKYVARMNLNSFSANTFLSISDLGEGVPIMSSRVQADQGTDWMRQNIILSGPFEVPEWTQQKGIYLEARSDGEHWKGMPHIERFDMIEVPESATRRAMVESGQAEMGEIPIKDWNALLEQGMARSSEGVSNARGILFQGNYWETEHPRNGDTLERMIDDSKPWIAKMDDMAGRERARDVRIAISQCVDREAILDTILAGQGRVAYVQYIHPDTALYGKVDGDTRWNIPFDCEGSKALLAKHGLSDGFTINDYWAGPSGVVVEMAEAMAATWLSELNIKVELDRQSYSTWRPGLISRTVNGVHGSFNPGTAPPIWASEWTWSAVASPAGYNSGNELPKASETVLAKEQTTNQEELEQLTLDWVDFIFEERIGFTVGTMPNNTIYNPEVIDSWEMRPMTNFRVGGMKSLENIILAK
jgi:ABC-type transport system substrate-binding protein